MGNPKTISWDWDYQSDALKIVVKFLDGSKTVFGITKESLTDMSAAKFVQLINAIVPDKPAPYTAQYMDEPKTTAQPYTATQAKTDMKAAKLAMYAKAYGMSEQAYKEMVNGPPPPNPIKELHVYDLGDGMLVPCELAHEIAAWIQQCENHGWYISHELIEDDLLGTIKEDISKAAVQDLANAVDDLIMKKYSGDLYPGKVIMIDDELSPYLTDPNSWFIDESKFYGKSIIEELLNTNSTQVTIPKKPKQIIKESLEYFHKLLGGKKYPF